MDRLGAVQVSTLHQKQNQRSEKCTQVHSVSSKGRAESGSGPLRLRKLFPQIPGPQGSRLCPATPGQFWAMRISGYSAVSFWGYDCGRDPCSFGTALWRGMKPFGWAVLLREDCGERRLLQGRPSCLRVSGKLKTFRFQSPSFGKSHHYRPAPLILIPSS